MSKAYDRVEWGILRAMLEKLGFDDKFITLSLACVTSDRYRIAHDGKEFGSIIPERGIRQGDPLSSYLFLICTEGFTVIIQDYERLGFIQGVKVARGEPMLSNLFFADDSYIFCRENKIHANHVVSLLSTFEKASRQQVNISKSSVFFSKNMSHEEKRRSMML